MTKANRGREEETNLGDLASKKRVLVADDDHSVRSLLQQVLTDEGYEVTTAPTGSEALRLLSANEGERPDVALIDQVLPDVTGLDILRKTLEQGLDVPIILITGMNSSSLTIQAIQKGAADYLTKPFDLDEVTRAVMHVLKYEDLKRSAEGTIVVAPKADPSERIVGSSPNMIQIFKTIGRVARTPATVLVTGETGTGKELMAEAIHTASDRRSGPLVKVNCAALPETLLESELFGHEKGSFTGAMTQHKGRFESADRGTIFLDEVGEMTLGTQKKLLRVLQEREFERVGGTAPVKVDVRVIAATNRTLRDEVSAGRFREDLFYRLNVIAIHMPPLSERTEDIPALVSHFLDKHRYSATSTPARITEGAMEKLLRHDWPGNVRELENIVQRAVVLSRGGVITEENIVFANELNRYVLDVEQKVRSGTPLDEMLRDVQKAAIEAAWRINDHDFEKTATQLGISEDQLRTHLLELRLLGELEQAPAHEYLPRAHRDA